MITTSRIAGFLVLFLLLAFLPVPISAYSEGVPVFALAQQDLNGDGRPDFTIIDCAFATDQDRVYVLDQADDMKAGTTWQEATDFTNDIWIFDVGADGTAQLIVDFAVEEDKYITMIYDDLDGDGKVAYRLEGDGIIIEESDFWYAKVVTNRYWTQYNVLPHAKMSILLDGDIPSYRLNDTAPHVEQDGLVDWEFDIGDKDRDGINDYQFQTVVSPFLRSSSHVDLKTIIRVQVENRRPTSYPDTDLVFWPMLIGKDAFYEFRFNPYFERPPAFVVDWEKGRVSNLGILGYAIEGYNISPRVPVDKHILNTVNWESPNANYNMAKDDDAWPELTVRFDLHPPFEPGWPSAPYTGKIEIPTLEVNYVWDQDNDSLFDYKLALGARHAIDQVVEFPDFAVKAVPYDDVIPWVKDQAWDLATFTHTPQGESDPLMYGRGWLLDRGYVDGDFIAPTGLFSNYLLGLTDSYPVQAYQDNQENVRGEYSFENPGKPRLYFSTLDRQLHLLTAQAGVWNLGNGRYIRYANLDNDAYLDQWQEERNGVVVQQLNYSNGVYVYSGRDNVRVQQTDSAPALFETQPPGSYEEWQQLDAQLKASEVDMIPANFTGMLKLLGGTVMEIQGAEVTGYRPMSDGGFRFELDLASGYQILGPDLLGLGERPPGNYVVENHKAVFTVISLIPAQLSLILHQAVGESNTLIQVTINNTGSTDALDLTLIVEAEDNQGRATELARRAVHALTDQAAQVNIDIPSTLTAGGTVRARLEDSEGQVVTISDEMSLASGDTSYRAAIFSIGKVPGLLTIVSIFAALITLAALLATTQLRARQNA